MAEHWIKIEKTTPDKPEIFEIAAKLSLTPDDVVGKLVRIWSWMDSHFDKDSAFCHKLSVTLVQIDRVAGATNFGQAMLEVDWLSESGIPHFDRHLGESAKKRAKDAERKRMSRQKADNCHKNNGQKVGPEEEEEEEEEREVKHSPVSKHASRDLEAAKQIYRHVIEAVPGTKTPNFEKWADTIRLMRERDNLTYEEIWKVFSWANADSFWRTNIRSPDKLREKLPVLRAKMIQGDSTSKSQQAIDASKVAAEQFLTSRGVNT